MHIIDNYITLFSILPLLSLSSSPSQEMLVHLIEETQIACNPYPFPQNLWCIVVPYHSCLPFELDSRCMFVHTISLYDVLGHPLVLVIASPQAPCYLFYYTDNRHAFWEMNTNKVADNEGFQYKFFKHGRLVLPDYLIDLLNHVVCSNFPQSQSHHTIHSIHESWACVDLKNYRAIMVGHCFFRCYKHFVHSYRGSFGGDILELEDR